MNLSVELLYDPTIMGYLRFRAKYSLRTPIIHCLILLEQSLRGRGLRSRGSLNRLLFLYFFLSFFPKVKIIRRIW